MSPAGGSISSFEGWLMSSFEGWLVTSLEGRGGGGNGGGKISSGGWHEQLFEAKRLSISGGIGKFFSLPPSELQSPRYPSSVTDNGGADPWSPLVDGSGVEAESEPSWLLQLKILFNWKGSEFCKTLLFSTTKNQSWIVLKSLLSFFSVWLMIWFRGKKIILIRI
jgi:hypothetical protein